MTTFQQCEDQICQKTLCNSKRSEADENSEYEQGKRFRAQGEFALAAAAFHNVLVQCEQDGDIHGTINAVYQLGLVCSARGDAEQALLHFMRAEDLCSREHDAMSQLAVAGQIIEMLIQKARYAEAVERCLILLDIYQDHNDPQGSVALIEKMATIYRKAGQYEKAADALRTVASIHSNFHHETIAEAYLVQAASMAQKVSRDTELGGNE